MPVILASEDSAIWLDPASQDIERLQPILCPYPPDEMTVYRVSGRVNNPATDTLEAVTHGLSAGAGTTYIIMGGGLL
jgi:putative SOS response-associated peptidase YedK